MSTSIAFLSASEMLRSMDRGELSPLEIAEACLAQVEQHNPRINAVVTLTEDVLEQARRATEALARGERRGPLHGLPVGIKDTTPTAGLRTTYGSPLYRDHVPARDALVVERLKKAGAIVLGKTNTPEFAAGGNTFNEVFGRTRNPWNPDLSAGGSTGGGAAALATGMITLAEGTDLGGSLRIPAAFCGVVGLRPSPGLVPKWPSEDLWDTLETTGPMARTAEDVALVLQAMAGPSPRVPVVQPIAGRDFVAAVRAGIPRGLRLAYCPDVAGIGVDPRVEKVCREAVFELRQAGCEVEEIALDLAFARPAFLTLRGLWMVTQQHERLGRLGELGANVAGNVRAGLAVTSEQLATARREQARLWSLLADLLGRYDHLLTPTMAVPPFPVEQNYPATVAGREMPSYVDWIAPTFVLSLAGLPAASVPCGLDEGGMPVGLQLVGRPQGEEAVLALAGVVEKGRGVGCPTLASA